MDQSAGTSLLVAAVIWAAFVSTASAQGGWRQWDVHLRDGTRRVANPLGAPDDTHLSVSVGGFEGRDSTIARSRVDYISAQRAAGSSLDTSSAATPRTPIGGACADVVVRRDGRRTTGHVTLSHVQYSEGVVRQGKDDIDLADVAYITFASRSRRRCTAPPARPATPHDSNMKRIP